jgi:DNA-binding NarL/FixJ family response regulator
LTGEPPIGGLALISGNHFDIALVDLGLPDGSGLQIIHALRTSTHVQPTYIVVATIYDDDKNLFAALKSGAQGYILKDHDKEKIVSYLQGVMRGITPLSSRVAKKKLVWHPVKKMYSNRSRKGSVSVEPPQYLG